MLPIWEVIRDIFPFHPNGKFLNIGVEEFWIIEHGLPIESNISMKSFSFSLSYAIRHSAGVVIAGLLVLSLVYH